MSKAKTIETLRSILGDHITTWLHAVRYYWLLHTIEDNEVEMRLIPHLVREGDVVIDVGANSADWTWRLSVQVGSQGRVFAFEADPYYAEVTRKVIILLGLDNVSFFKYGLSDRAATGLLWIRTPDHERVVATGHIIDETEATDLEAGHAVQVRLVPLDEVPELKPYAGSVRLIKCDVEGHELNVFKGALSILSGSRPYVITEVGHMDYHVDNERELLSFFQKLDYGCYVVGPDAHSLLPSRAGDDYSSEVRPNRIMIPRERSLDDLVTIREV